jgi:DNA-binding XRE family transcriptional regulator
MATTPLTRLENPLRKLRVILGEFAQPMSQDQFARLIGVSYATVQAIENGRRKLNDECLLAIEKRLWAQWHPANETWYPIFDPKRPYSKADAELARSLTTSDQSRDPVNIDYLQKRIADIYRAIPATYRGLGPLLHLHRRLEQAARELGVGTDVLKATEPVWKAAKAIEPILKATRQMEPAFKATKAMEPALKAARRMTQAIYPEYPGQDSETQPKKNKKVQAAQRRTRKNKRTYSAPKRKDEQKSSKKKVRKLLETSGLHPA